MGFFDCRCMVTGVSLKGADAALVILYQADSEYVPISLAIKGNYNRLGSIDGIEEDANTRLVLRFFLDGLRSGAFRVDEHSLVGCQCFSIQSIGDLLQGFERNMNDGPSTAVLHNQSVVFALIARSVWDTITQDTPISNEPAPAMFQRLYGALSVGMKIYAGAIEEVSGHIVEFAAVDAFLRSRELRWQPSEGGGQDYSEEMRQYLDEARRTFSDSATINKALRQYEKEIGDLLDDV